MGGTKICYILHTTDYKLASLIWLWIMRQSVIQFILHEIQHIPSWMMEDRAGYGAYLSELIYYLDTLCRLKKPVDVFRTLRKLAKHNQNPNLRDRLTYCGCVLTMGDALFDGFIIPTTSDDFPVNIDDMWKDVAKRDDVGSPREWLYFSKMTKKDQKDLLAFIDREVHPVHEKPVIKKSNNDLIIGGSVAN